MFLKLFSLLFKETNMEKDWWKGKVASSDLLKTAMEMVGTDHGETRLPSRFGDWYPLVISSFTRVRFYWPGPWYFLTIMPLILFFGTWKIWRSWIEGKKRGISIIMDLVVNHCSSHHEWSQSSSGSRRSYADFLFHRKWQGNPTTGKATLRQCLGTRSWHQQILSPFFPQGSAGSHWQNPVYAKRFTRWSIGGQGNCRLPIVNAIINIKKDLEWRLRFHPDRDNGLVPVPESLVTAQLDWTFLARVGKSVLSPSTNAFTVGEANENWRRVAFLHWKKTVSSSINFSNKPCWVRKKGCLTMLPTADELAESIFRKRMSA